MPRPRSANEPAWPPSTDAAHAVLPAKLPVEASATNRQVLSCGPRSPAIAGSVAVQHILAGTRCNRPGAGESYAFVSRSPRRPNRVRTGMWLGYTSWLHLNFPAIGRIPGTNCNFQFALLRRL